MRVFAVPFKWWAVRGGHCLLAAADERFGDQPSRFSRLGGAAARPSSSRWEWVCSLLDF
jgi:hypothetical protein